MIWYRHWLELRPVMLLGCVAALVASVGYGYAVADAGNFALPGQDVATAHAMRGIIPAPHLVPWAFHTLIVGFLVLFISPFFQGTGFAAIASATTLRVGHPSRYFTASLPLSRAGVIVSRLVAAVAGVAAVLALSLLTHCIVLLVIRQPLPFAAMATTSLLGVVIGIGLIAVGAFVSLAVRQGAAPVALLVVTLLGLTQGGWNIFLDVVSGSSIGPPAAVMVASLLLVTIGIAAALRKEL
jgi:hypothetical protein